jgi:uncharacterized membrane protein/Tfp pilus assembly protein PilF
MDAPTTDVWNVEGLSRRIGLLAVGMLLFDVSFTVWHQIEPFRSPRSLGLLLVANVLGLALIVLALVRRPPSRLNWLILIGVIFVSMMRLHAFNMNFHPTGPVQTDTGMITGYAVEALAHGHNPYTWNFGDFLRVYRASPLYITPHVDGSIQNKAAYPALTYWLFWISRGLGLSVPETTFMGLMVMLILLFVTAPQRWRPLVLLPLVIFEDYTHFALVGNQDTLLSLLLVGMLIAWSNPKWRAMLFGMACAFRQQAWFIAPFLLIEMWKRRDGTTTRWRQIFYFTSISAGIFVLINLPFVIWNPRAWWLGVFEHSYAPFNVYSHGLGTLSQYGILPLPRQFYTALQMTSLAGMLILHWRHPRFVGQAFWIFPALFFWLYYRGLTNYWIYWVPPLLYALIHHTSNRDACDEQTFEQSQSWVRTAALVSPPLILTVIWGIILSLRPIPIDVDYKLPLETMTYSQILVKRMRVTVTNKGHGAFMPRFAVQHDTGVQALPWRIESGPEILRPGQTGEYLIDAGIADRAFAVDTGGQIVVTDAQGDYRQRAVETIPPDPSFGNPDLIANPGFHFWPEDKGAPIAWSISATTKITNSLELTSVEGKPSLILRVDGPLNSVGPKGIASAKLVQSITFPPELTVWVHPMRSSSNPLEQPYGFEFNDGNHRLWVLFSHTDTYEKLNDTFAYICLRAPMQTWSQHTLPLHDFYALLEWQLPDLSVMRRNGLEYRARQVQFGLLFPNEGASVFGPIEQDPQWLSTDTFWSEVLAHPDLYYAQRGDEYYQQRNYDLAQEAYRKALAYNPTHTESYFGLAEASFWLDEWLQAAEAFEKSLAHRYPQPALAYRGMAWSYYNLGNLDKAKQAFEQATQTDPDLADAYNGLGWIAVQNDQCNKALVHFKRALILEPDFTGPRRGLEMCEE